MNLHSVIRISDGFSPNDTVLHYPQAMMERTFLLSRAQQPLQVSLIGHTLINAQVLTRNHLWKQNHIVWSS